MKIKIRYNTAYPLSGKKWRVLREDNSEIQVDEFISINCLVESDTSDMPNVGIKHHVMVNCKKMTLEENKHSLKAIFE